MLVIVFKTEISLMNCICAGDVRGCAELCLKQKHVLLSIIASESMPNGKWKQERCRTALTFRPVSFEWVGVSRLPSV